MNWKQHIPQIKTMCINGYTIEALAAYYSVPSGTMARAMQRHGIKANALREADRIEKMNVITDNSKVISALQDRIAELEANLKQAKKLLSQNANTMAGMTTSNILLLDRVTELEKELKFFYEEVMNLTEKG